MRTIELRAVLVSIVVLVTPWALHAQPTVGTAFTYQGQLKQSGVPVEGATDFKFSLWDAESGGGQVGSTLLFDGQSGNADAVTVNEGLFTVALDFGTSAFVGDARWLEIEVRSPHDPNDTEAYTPLVSRQALRATPYALFALDSAGGTTSPWLEVGDDIYYNDGNVGIGTTAPESLLHIYGFGGTTTWSFENTGGTVIVGTPAGDPGLTAYADSGARRDIRFTDEGIRLLTSASDSPPGGANGITINESGNVGIGTSTPGAKLHVSGGTSGGSAWLSAYDFVFENDSYSVLNIVAPETSSSEIAFSDTERLQGSIRYLHGSDAMDFGTAGTTGRMHLDASGNLGIGTTNPGAKLDVAGTVKSTGFRMTTSPTAGHVLTCDASGVGTWQAPSGGVSLWSESGSDIYYDAGNVGIGTSTPGFPLSFSSDSGDKISLWGSGGPSYGFGIQSNLLQIHTPASVADIAFGYGSSGAFAETMRIKGNGNVGIGTPDPSFRLHVLADGTDGIKIQHTGVGDYPQLRWTDPNDVRLAAISVGTAIPQMRFFVNGADRMTVDSDGSVGIGTTAPGAKLTLAGAEDADLLSFAVGGADRFSIISHASSAPDYLSIRSKFDNPDTDIAVFRGNGRVGIGTTDPQVELDVVGTVIGTHSSGSFGMLGTSEYGVTGEGTTAGGYFQKGTAYAKLGTTSYGVDASGGYAGGRFADSGGSGVALLGHGDVGIEASGNSYAGVFNGPISVEAVEITGADLAEKFPVSEAVEPGMVVAIDPQRAGQLRLARGAYNRCVAGIASGAGDLRPGAVLGHLPGQEEAPPIALSGRVWAYCDATSGAIQPGDLLTTSGTPGHAMKVTDHEQARGAIIGKAMTPLAEGRGLVLVLVQPQ